MKDLYSILKFPQITSPNTDPATIKSLLDVIHQTLPHCHLNELLLNRGEDHTVSHHEDLSKSDNARMYQVPLIRRRKH